jgi:ribosomal subunit interface protein
MPGKEDHLELEPQITFRNIAPSPAIEDNVRQHMAKLERFHKHIISCRVTIEAPHRHHHKGQLYQVAIDLSVPGGELLANRGSDKNHAHEDVYVAIRDAFQALRRQLEQFASKRRGDVKAHEGPPEGRIAKLFADQEYGFIETLDGREIYFHAHAVLNDGYAKLAVGDVIEFVEEMGEKGPQASTVRPVTKTEKTA